MMAFLDNLFPWFGYMVSLGGNILLLLVALAAVLWAMIFERIYFLTRIYDRSTERAQLAWRERTERSSWYAQQYRRHLIHTANRSLQRNLGLLKTLIRLCPLLGLLGTVLGMLDIFDAVAITGSNNPRATAGGVSKAIVTTMAGMVIAISALPVVAYLNRVAASKRQMLANRLPLDG